MARAPRIWRLGFLRLPASVAALVAGMTALSLLAVILARNGAPGFLDALTLRIPAVLTGQLWRVLSWPLLALDPLSLLFDALMLVWIGGDLVRLWGDRRFLSFFFGLAAAVAVVATGVAALVFGPHAAVTYAGAGPVIGGAVIAWSHEHRARDVRLYGVVRVQGRHLVAITLGVTALCALYFGFVWAIPHAAAQGLVLLACGPLARLRKKKRTAAAAQAKSFQFSDWLDREWRGR